MLALLASGVAAQPPCAESQASMLRAKRYWRLPVEVTPTQALRQGRGEVRAWAQKCFGASYRSPRRVTAGRREGPSELGVNGPADGGGLEDLLQDQVDRSIAKQGPGSLHDLLHSGDTWDVK